MLITVNVALNRGEPENWTMSLNEIADAVLKALGGDEAIDHCVVTMTVPATGEAGTPPAPPAPFMVQQGTMTPTEGEPEVEPPPTEGPGGGKPK